MRANVWRDQQASGRPLFAQMELLHKGGKKIHPLLYDLLVQATPHESEGVIREILLKFFTEHCGLTYSTDNDKTISIDKSGNMHVDIRDKPAEQRSMFSCHMDTVHHKYEEIDIWVTKANIPDVVPGIVWAGTREYRYDLFDPVTKEPVDINDVCKKHKIKFYTFCYDEKSKGPKGTIRIDIKKGKYKTDIPVDCGVWVWGRKTSYVAFPETLGADDKVGCYIAARMIQKRIPGLYVFHVGEERSCKGSRWITTNLKEKFQGKFDRCVAFDRAGYTDVIHTQRNSPTCSSAFSNELAEELNKSLTIPPKQQFQGGIHGVYTDSAEYKDLIPECTNVSVGYFDQHGPGEHFDLIWLENMFIPAVLEVDWEGLSTVRDPKPYVAPMYNQNRYNNNNNVQNYTGKTIEVKDIVWNTPDHLLPKWAPMDGLLTGASEEAMKMIIRKYIKAEASSEYKQTDIILDLIGQIADLADHVMMLRKKYNVVDLITKVEANDDENLASDMDPNGPFATEDNPPPITQFNSMLKDMEMCPCGAMLDIDCTCSPEERVANAEVLKSDEELISKLDNEIIATNDPSIELTANKPRVRIKVGKTEIEKTLADPEVQERLSK